MKTRPLKIIRIMINVGKRETTPLKVIPTILSKLESMAYFKLTLAVLEPRMIRVRVGRYLRDLNLDFL